MVAAFLDLSITKFTPSVVKIDGHLEKFALDNDRVLPALTSMNRNGNERRCSAVSKDAPMLVTFAASTGLGRCQPQIS